MFRKLLVPLDRSSLAEQAIGPAAAIARASGAEMDLVLVHQPFPFDGFDDAPWNAEQSIDERPYLESIAAEISSEVSVPVTYDVLRGEAIESICRRAGEVQADLVVMTSHGRTGLSRAWLGSVADGVVRHSTIPILVLRPIEGKARQLAAHHPFKRVLVPLDDSALATEALPAATALAKCSNARISLLRVVQPVPLISAEAGVPYAGYRALVDDPATKYLETDAKEQLADVARRLRDETGLEVDAHVVVEPRVGTAIVDFARGKDTDLIAMSTHGRGLSRLLIGSVADKVLRGSGLPMLVYRPLAARRKSETTEFQTEAPLSHA